MPTYSAYGLTVQSELLLPELAEADGTPDATITLGRIDAVPTPVDADGHGFWARPGEACHVFENVGAFLVREGREIIVDSAPDADPGLLRLSVLGPAISLLLHQRGHLILHASSVVIDGGAVAFVGWRGWGKSTLAAVMHARGHKVIADDVTAVDLTSGTPAVLPGIPQVRLWPDAVTALGTAPESLPRLHPHFDKRALRVTEGFPRAPVPLRRIHVLAVGPAAKLEEIAPGEAILELIRHWYGGRFGDQLLAIGNTAATHLQQCGNLAASVPVRRLSRPRLTWSAEHLAGLVEADLTHS